MAPRIESLPFLITLSRTKKWGEVIQILTPDNITLDELAWAHQQGQHDCAETRRLAAYMLMRSDAVVEPGALKRIELWMIGEGGSPIRAMLAVALYKRGYRTPSVNEDFKKALADALVGETARKYHLQAA